MPGADRLLLLVGLVGFAFMEAMASSTASSECVPSACLVKYCVADRTESRNLRCSSVILCGSSLMGIILLLQLFASGLTHGGALSITVWRSSGALYATLPLASSTVYCMHLVPEVYYMYMYMYMYM